MMFHISSGPSKEGLEKAMETGTKIPFVGRFDGHTSDRTITVVLSKALYEDGSHMGFVMEGHWSIERFIDDCPFSHSYYDTRSRTGYIEIAIE